MSVRRRRVVVDDLAECRIPKCQESMILHSDAIMPNLNETFAYVVARRIMTEDPLLIGRNILNGARCPSTIHIEFHGEIRQFIFRQ